MTTFAPGSLVRARGREWVVLPDSDDELLVLRPLGGNDDDTAAVLPALEQVAPAQFAPPGPADLGDAAGGALLRTALQIGFRSSAGPGRSVPLRSWRSSHAPTSTSRCSWRFARIRCGS